MHTFQKQERKRAPKLSSFLAGNGLGHARIGSSYTSHHRVSSFDTFSIGTVKSELMAAATKKKQKDFETKMRLLLGGGYY